MKKLIAIAVLCVASMAMAQIDDDLTATFNAAGETILTNTGDDTIGLATFGFLDPTWSSITAKGDPNTGAGPFPNPFMFFGAVAETDQDVTVTNLNFTHQLEAGGTRNLGVINSAPYNAAPYYWEQSFTAEGDEVAYLFTLVPEPASMSMLALGALALIRRRK